MKLSILASLIASALLVGCGESERTPSPAAPAPPVPVQTVAVAPSDWPNVYEATGTVRARVSAPIAAKVMGYVREVRVQAGDRVQAGQLLVLIDSRDLDAQLKQAEAARNEASSAIAEADSGIAGAKANVDLAEVTYKRMQDLFASRSISNQEMDEANARLKAAQATLAIAQSRRAQLAQKIAQAEEAAKGAAIARSYTEIAAPFAGTVTEKRVDPGAMTTPGTPLLTIEREGMLRLEADIEESHTSQIRAGTPVAVTLDALNQTLRGQVTEIVPSVDAASRTYIAKIDLPAIAQLRSGMFGRARFELGKRTGLAVPAAAVVERGQLQSVYVVENGIAHSRLITLGEQVRAGREVLSGLMGGERIVSPVPAGLADGARVEVQQ